MMIVFGLLLIYVLVILSLLYGFNSIETEVLDTKTSAKSTFSVIIPFKDEAEHLPFLLKSISELKYPKHLFEVILINDASEDESVELIHQFIETSQLTIHLMHSSYQSASPKKEALKKAISKAQHEWIVTTDADCTFGEFWLHSYNQFILKNAVNFISAPVTYHTNRSFFEAFQHLDFISLIGVTIGSFGLKKPLMCNGANLAYKKTFFNRVNGFEGNSNIASGDDVFLLEKALSFNKKKVKFLKMKTAAVYTKPVKTVGNLVAQRKRWASKTSKSNSIETKLLGLLVLMINGLFVLSILNVAIQIIDYKYSLVFMMLKISVDVLLIAKTLVFFNQLSVLSNYLLTSIIYPFFNVYIAILSLFGGYKWKNRTYKR